MSLSPQKFREIVLQLLYSYDMGHPEEEALLTLIMSELAISKKNVKLAYERTQQVIQKLNDIDPLIASVSTSYAFDRIQIVIKNILRLGIFELFFDDKIPPKVAIAEAIRLSRKFSTPESASFVNALLDHLYQASLGGKVDASHLEKLAENLAKSEEISQQAALEANPEPNEEEE